MRFTAALLLIISFYFSAQASPIYGLLSVANDKLMLIQENQRFEIASASIDVDRDLARLSSGDFVALEGFYNISQKKIIVNSVDWVGLKKVLGHWKTADKKIIEFRDYTTLMLHNYLRDGFPVKHSVKPRTRDQSIEMNYRMAPGVGSSWTLFISDGKKLHMGRMNLAGANISIGFFDIETGKIIKTLKLSRQSFVDEYL